MAKGVAHSRKGWREVEAPRTGIGEPGDGSLKPTGPQAELEHGRGRLAAHPKDIPAPGWRDILLRVFRKLGQDNATLVAAGIALNSLLAVFPALAVAVTLYGMFSSPASVASDVEPFFAILPPQAAVLLQDQLQSLVSPARVKLGLGALISALLAFWSARQGMSALMTATNIAYHEREQRSFLRQAAISLGFTLAAVVAFLMMLLFGVAVPVVLKMLPLGSIAENIILAVRWVLLWGFTVVALGAVYRYAPDRQRPQWRWVLWGSTAAATLWLLGSVLFELYVKNFSSYGATYGALGGVIVLIMWFYLGGFAVVFGAEINAEMEHQTAVDTTDGPPAPMGQRGAYVADTLGKTSE
jgi:membrane protein